MMAALRRVNGSRKRWVHKVFAWLQVSELPGPDGHSYES